MKKKWKQLSKVHRKLIIYSGLCNVFALLVQFAVGFRLSVWLAGVGNGMFITFVMISFGFLPSPSELFQKEVPGNE